MDFDASFRLHTVFLWQYLLGFQLSIWCLRPRSVYHQARMKRSGPCPKPSSSAQILTSTDTQTVCQRELVTYSSLNIPDTCCQPLIPQITALNYYGWTCAALAGGSLFAFIVSHIHSLFRSPSRLTAFAVVSLLNMTIGACWNIASSQVILLSPLLQDNTLLPYLR